MTSPRLVLITHQFTYGEDYEVGGLLLAPADADFSALLAEYVEAHRRPDDGPLWANLSSGQHSATDYFNWLVEVKGFTPVSFTEQNLLDGSGVFGEYRPCSYTVFSGKEIS